MKSVRHTAQGWDNLIHHHPAKSSLPDPLFIYSFDYITCYALNILHFCRTCHGRTLEHLTSANCTYHPQPQVLRMHLKGRHRTEASSPSGSWAEQLSEMLRPADVRKESISNTRPSQSTAAPSPPSTNAAFAPPRRSAAGLHRAPVARNQKINTAVRK